MSTYGRNGVREFSFRLCLNGVEICRMACVSGDGTWICGALVLGDIGTVEEGCSAKPEWFLSVSR